MFFLLDKEMCCCECTSHMNQMANSNEGEVSDNMQSSVEEDRNDDVSNEKSSPEVDERANQGFRRLLQNHKTMWPVEDNKDTSKSSSNEMDYTEDKTRNNPKKKQKLNIIHIKEKEAIR